ncbi:MAG: PhnD/SsuA/transferrin family substrate-binding protein [Puniceicoccaceae bacterium]
MKFLGLFRCALFIGVGLGLSACGPDRSRSERPDTIRFADTGVEGIEEMRRAFHDFVSTMEEKTGLKVDFYPVSNRTIAAVALEAGDVDVVLAGPTEYLFIKSRQNVIPIAAIERAEYYSVIIVPSDSPARSLTDLRGKTVAFKNSGSTSGHVAPTAMFMEAGMIEGEDYLGPQADRLRFEMLHAGDVDAIAGGIKDFRRLEKERPGEYRVLARGEPLPRDIFVARAGLHPDVVEQLKTTMIANGEEIMRAILAPGEATKYVGAGIVAANDSDYDEMRAVHRALDIPFDE